MKLQYLSIALMMTAVSACQPSSGHDNNMSQLSTNETMDLGSEQNAADHHKYSPAPAPATKAKSVPRQYSVPDKDVPPPPGKSTGPKKP